MKSDIIWSHWIIPSGVLGASFKKLIRKRHILTVHSSIPPVLKNSPFSLPILKFILRHTDKIVVVSSSIKEELLSCFPPYLKMELEKKLHIIPMGIDRHFYQKRASKYLLRKKYNIHTKHLILFLGRLVEIKGISYLIRAVRNLDNYSLIIAGEGDQKEALMNLARKLKVYVRWAGTISLKEKFDYLTMCDLVVMPSIRTSSGQSEGLPVAILEALACAKPVISTKTGGIPDTVKDGYNGFLVKERDAAAISEKLNFLFKNESLLNRMGKNALAMSKLFDLDLIAIRYIELLN